MRFGGPDWPRISRSFDEAVELEGEARAAWLDDLRSRDPTLADAVQAMLAEHEAAGSAGFLATPIAGLMPEPSAAGRKVGPYELQEPIASGGSGSVWRARRSDGKYDDEVAVKLLNLALAGTRGSANFRHEAGILARLRHPNIAYLLDAGVTDDGQAYLVLELIDGEAIDTWCDGRSLGIEARLRLALDVLAAVAHAHRHLIVHRDLKPSNVMVRADGQVKLLDFGIAKLVQGDATGAGDATTLFGGRAMTPAYAAPEQLQGRPTTTATDVYAFGVMLYQLLCGHHPNRGDMNDIAAFMRTTLEDEPERMSRTLVPGVRADAATLERIAAARGTTVPALRRRLEGDLDNILARALQKDPQQRYASIEAFADDLRCHLEMKPVSARADAFGYRIGRFVRRHRAGVAAATTAVLALVVGAGVSVWQMLEARHEREVARAQAAKAEASRRFLQLMFAEMGAEGAPLTAAEIVARGAHLLDARYATTSPTTVDQLIQLAGGYAFTEEFDKRRSTLLRAEAMAVELADDERTAEARCNLVSSELARGDREQARHWHAAAHEVLGRLHGASAALRADCLHADALLQAADGKFAEAMDTLRRGLAVLEAAGESLHPSYASILSRMASTSLDMGDPRASFDYARRNRLVLEAMGRGGTKDMITSMNNEAAALNGFGEVVGAERLQAEVLRRAGARDPNGKGLSTMIGNHATMLTTLARYDEAAALVDMSLARAREAGDAPMILRASFQRARIELRAGRLDEAQRELDAVEAEYRRDEEMNARWLRYVAATRAELQLRQGRIDAARQTMHGLLAAIGHPHEQTSIELVNALPLAAEIALAAGDAQGAQQLAADAAQVAQRFARDATQSADAGKAWWQLARARQALGDAAGEREALGRAVVALGAGLGAEHPLTRQARERAKAIGLVRTAELRTDTGDCLHSAPLLCR